MDESLFFTHTFFLIFTGSAIVATVALYTRQPLLIAYIVIGAILGPHGYALIADVDTISDISKIGIVFLLFLLGLDMQPQRLMKTLKVGVVSTLISGAVFGAAGFFITYGFGFSVVEASIVGACCIFSSTIIGIKLLPTTVLHHRRTGELIVGILLVQDMVAVLILLAIMTSVNGQFEMTPLLKAFAALPVLIAAIFLMVKCAILPLVQRFDRFHEYIFLLAIGWCMGCAELAHYIGLSAEIGAFVAGITLATSPIAQYIASSLKPLRDFFLILFFFSLGAGIDLIALINLIPAVIALSATMLILKPILFKVLLKQFSDNDSLAWDVGFRLGQISEFSLLIAFLAVEKHLISGDTSLLIQATAIATFVISSYIVILNYPNPIAITDRLRRD
ncbi:Iron transporter MagA [Sinobacterium norvegicum]|uniref:Iron transporter MagA n=1 Tax=Sinobacterium norvegicum TaxID=1641715 RepID=A0ABN8ED20_9GAMM|nr:cation:proton antiporter [Sinobacterium norvegicum]CAH0990253.1 Iron transporter MagA [Sinobacterium norvegicum]